MTGEKDAGVRHKSDLDELEWVLVHANIEPGHIAAGNRCLWAARLREKLEALVWKTLHGV